MCSLANARRHTPSRERARGTRRWGKQAALVAEPVASAVLVVLVMLGVEADAAVVMAEMVEMAELRVERVVRVVSSAAVAGPKSCRMGTPEAHLFLHSLTHSRSYVLGRKCVVGTGGGCSLGRWQHFRGNRSSVHHCSPICSASRRSTRIRQPPRSSYRSATGMTREGRERGAGVAMKEKAEAAGNQCSSHCKCRRSRDQM